MDLELGQEACRLAIVPAPISHLGEAVMLALKLSGKESHSNRSTRKDRFNSSKASLNNENSKGCLFAFASINCEHVPNRCLQTDLCL